MLEPALSWARVGSGTRTTSALAWAAAATRAREAAVRAAASSAAAAGTSVLAGASLDAAAVLVVRFSASRGASMGVRSPLVFSAFEYSVRMDTPGRSRGARCVTATKRAPRRTPHARVLMCEKRER